MQLKFAAFNFKSSSNDQDGLSPSTLEENIDASHFSFCKTPSQKFQWTHCMAVVNRGYLHYTDMSKYLINPLL